jgi:hypothetical protein
MKNKGFSRRVAEWEGVNQLRKIIGLHWLTLKFGRTVL